MMNKILGWVVLGLCMIGSSQGNPAWAQTTGSHVHLGIVGDSGADEYRANDNRGGVYGNTTLNWVEQLIKSRGVDVGPWSSSSRGEPRRAGYEYNWARSGATSYTMISQNQHTGLAQQIAQGKIDTVILHIGANDFTYACYVDPTGRNYCGIFEDIYYRRLTGTALQAKLNEITTNIKLAIDTIANASATSNHPIDLIVGSINDRSMVPYAISTYPNATQRQLVSDAIRTINTNIQNYSQVKSFTFIDLNAKGTTMLNHLVNGRYFSICQELIDFGVAGDEPHHIMIGDNEHAGTVMEGQMANYFVAVFKAPVTALTDWEIVQNAGIIPQNPSICPGYPNATPTPAPTIRIGDANQDGFVNGLDYLIWRYHYNQSVTGFTYGDFDNSGRVDGLDYLLWRSHYGT